MTEPSEISLPRLADWLEGRLTEEEEREVERRLESASDATRANAAWLRGFLEAGARTPRPALPEEVRETLSRRFESYAEDRREPGVFSRLAATLSFDSDAGAAMAGIRSAGGAEGEEAQRQLVYSSERADVALDVRKRPGGQLDLGGQILPAEHEPGSFSVQLLWGTEEFGIAEADELGEFSFKAISPGVYELVLSADGVEITVGPVGLEV